MIQDAPSATGGRRLDSWKEIAAYLRRDVKTARRWEEREGLPVHRQRHGVLGSVYAFEEEIESWRVRRATIPAGPPPVRRGATPLVGRTQELSCLHTALAHAREGTRQIVFVSGEFGVGKTALAQTFLSGLDESVWIAEGQCVEQFGAGEPYLPFIEILTRLAKDTGDRRVADLIEREAPSWSDTLLPRSRPRAPRPSPLGGPDRSARELCRTLEALAVTHPLVLLLEDLHWSDHATVELLARLARRAEPVPMLIIATYRPAGLAESQSAMWRVSYELAAHFQATELRVPFLNEAAVAEYLESSGSWADLQESSRWFHSRTEGNALFLVHLVQHLIDADHLIRSDGKWCLDAAVTKPSTVVPHTLTSLIQTQVTALDQESRRVLEIASVAGQVFAAASIADAAQSDLGHIEHLLQRLVSRREFIDANGPTHWPDGAVSSSYRFIHQFYRELLYQGLASGTRARLHLCIGERLETAYGQSTGAIAAELAMHFERGHDLPRAIAQYRDASEHAFARGAQHEAHMAITAALALLAQFPPSRDRDIQELEFRLRESTALTNLHTMTHPAVEEALKKAVALADTLDDVPFSTMAIGWYSRTKFVLGDIAACSDLCDRALRRARAGGGGLAMALNQKSTILLVIGDFSQSAIVAEEALTSVDNADLGSAALNVTQMNLNVLAWTSWSLGDYDECFRFIDLIQDGAGRQEPVNAAYALAWIAPLVEYCGISDRSMSLLESASEIAVRFDIDQVQLWTRTVRGWLLARRGQAADGVAQARAAIDGTKAARLRTWLPWQLSWLAEALLIQGDTVATLRTVAEALDISGQIGARALDSELLRLRGEAQRLNGEPERSETSFREGIELAAIQGARTFALRCALSFAHLYADTGNYAEGRRILAPVCTSFKERFVTPDMREARSFLATLS